MNSISSGIYNSLLGIGQILSPPFSTFSTDKLGFRMTTDIVGLICLAFGTLYFIFGGGVSAVLETITNFKRKIRYEHLENISAQLHCNSCLAGSYHYLHDASFIQMDASLVEDLPKT